MDNKISLICIPVKKLSENQFGVKHFNTVGFNDQYDLIMVTAKKGEEYRQVKTFSDTQFPGKALEMAKIFVKQGNERLQMMYKLEETVMALKTNMEAFIALSDSGGADIDKLLYYTYTVQPFKSESIAEDISYWTGLISDAVTQEAEKLSGWSPTFFEQTTFNPIPETISEDL